MINSFHASLQAKDKKASTYNYIQEKAWENGVGLERASLEGPTRYPSSTTSWLFDAERFSKTSGRTPKHSPSSSRILGPIGPITKARAKRLRI
ncbi:hypothetical protein VNO77_03213 [Canavalia gladiata]|uniref:Uncharacterized protein n=1 Tax=Canavalia gladiata TaxID=3824 RepID=A0AAN9MUZ2_CANGL